MVLSSESSLEHWAKFRRCAERPRAAPGDVVAGGVTPESYIPYACSPDSDRPGTMQVEMLVHAKASKNIRRGTLVGWLADSVEHLEAEPIRRDFAPAATDCSPGTRPSRDFMRDCAGGAPQRQKALKDIPRLGRGRDRQGGATQRLHKGRLRRSRGAGCCRPAAGSRRGTGCRCCPPGGRIRCWRGLRRRRSERTQAPNLLADRGAGGRCRRAIR